MRDVGMPVLERGIVEPELVESYADLARFWWRTGQYPHGPHSCGCLPCAELRAELGMAPLIRAVRS